MGRRLIPAGRCGWLVRRPWAVPERRALPMGFAAQMPRVVRTARQWCHMPVVNTGHIKQIGRWIT
jgi:hypothetical protein